MRADQTQVEASDLLVFRRTWVDRYVRRSIEDYTERVNRSRLVVTISEFNGEVAASGRA